MRQFQSGLVLLQLQVSADGTAASMIPTTPTRCLARNKSLLTFEPRSAIITIVEEKGRYLKMYDSLTPTTNHLLARFRSLKEVTLLQKVNFLGCIGRSVVNPKPLDRQLKRLWWEAGRQHGSAAFELRFRGLIMYFRSRYARVFP